MDIKEFEIPVPWGHVAVKACGNEEDTPVLMLHGLGDNAGSFDRLIPHLPSSFYYICIDLPSHGRSSPYPPYLFISALDNVLTMKLVMDHLKRKKYILLGHSWGGQTGIMFTQLYPEYITKLIILDAFYLFPMTINNFQDSLTEKFRILTKLNENMGANKQPQYTYEEAVEKLISGRFYGELFQESAEPIAKRCLIPTENGKYKMSTDPRLKAFLNPLILDLRYITGLLKKYPITCPILFIYASDSEAQYYYFKNAIKEYRKNKHCVIKKVTGSHDVHNNTPELVAPIITKFLTKMKGKL